MKRFIDDDGTFEIKVPATWRYSLKNGKVHTFQEYEIWKSDAFQLSIMKVKNGTEKNNFLRIAKSSFVSKIGDLEYYCFPDSVDKQFTIKTWTRMFEDKIVLFTLTHPNDTDKNLDSTSIQEKTQTVFSIIKGFRLIDETRSMNEINSYRFEMFLQGVGATSLILSKAVENKAFIEATCVIANQIDALLRIGIVLKNQIINSNREIETEWIYQGLSDKKKTEKDVYKKSLNLEIIDETIFDDLCKLYDDRNRVIHRFIISEITLAEVEEIAYKYHIKSEALNKIIYDLESEQIKLNVGMTSIGNENEDVNHLNFIKGKIGKLNYFNDKDNVK